MIFAYKLKKFESSRHFVFVLICQSSPHSTADFYQNSPYFVNKPRKISHLQFVRKVNSVVL